MSIPALLSRKTNTPVMMRITREEESYIGRSRNLSGRARVGTAKDGRITAVDLFIVADTGAYGRSATIVRQALRRRSSISLLHALAFGERHHQHAAALKQRSPGPMQANGIMEPVITKAAKQLGIDQLQIAA